MESGDEVAELRPFASECALEFAGPRSFRVHGYADAARAGRSKHIECAGEGWPRSQNRALAIEQQSSDQVQTLLRAVYDEDFIASRVDAVRGEPFLQSPPQRLVTGGGWVFECIASKLREDPIEGLSDAFGGKEIGVGHGA